MVQLGEWGIYIFIKLLLLVLIIFQTVGIVPRAGNGPVYENMKKIWNEKRAAEYINFNFQVSINQLNYYLQSFAGGRSTD